MSLAQFLFLSFFKNKLHELLNGCMKVKSKNEFRLTYLCISPIKADLTIRAQTSNDSDCDDNKLRRRKLSFESVIDKGNSFLSLHEFALGRPLAFSQEPALICSIYEGAFILSQPVGLPGPVLSRLTVSFQRLML